MYPFMRDFIEQMRSMDTEAVKAAANFKLSCVLIRQIGIDLNMTHAAAAEIVGKMKVEVSNDTYNDDPEAWDDAARVVVGVLRSMFEAFRGEFGEATAHAYIQHAANQLSLSHD